MLVFMKANLIPAVSYMQFIIIIIIMPKLNLPFLCLWDNELGS